MFSFQKIFDNPGITKSSSETVTSCSVFVTGLVSPADVNDVLVIYLTFFNLPRFTAATATATTTTATA